MSRTSAPPLIGPLREYLEQYTNERRLLGYKDTNVSSCLRHFDRFSVDYECIDCLPKCLVLAWIEHKPHWQSASTQQNRITIMRKFAEFMIRQGKDAYVVPKSYWPKSHSAHVPYVFSHDEIGRLLQAADSRFCEDRPALAVLYRLLYCCGLRVSEALNLCICHVDLENSVLTVLDAKNSRDRYVPMSEELTEVCRRYRQAVFPDGTDPAGFFFPSPRGGAYTASYIYHQFRELLNICGIPHRGSLYGPRLHDLRHTFSVHSFQKEIESGRDAMEILPILAVYLGHKTYHGTSLYLHLTPEAYSHITDSTADIVGKIFSKVGVSE